MASKRTARDPADAVGAMTNFLQSPAANGFLISQKLAWEATRFWARRMRAYADQMEECARCSNPEEFVAAQQRFLARMQEDYAHETNAMTELVAEVQENVRQEAAPPRGANGGANERERPNA